MSRGRRRVDYARRHHHHHILFQRWAEVAEFWAGCGNQSGTRAARTHVRKGCRVRYTATTTTTTTDNSMPPPTTPAAVLGNTYARPPHTTIFRFPLLCRTHSTLPKTTIQPLANGARVFVCVCVFRTLRMCRCIPSVWIFIPFFCIFSHYRAGLQDTFPSPHSHTHPRPRFVALEAICFGASNSTTCLGRREGCCRPPSSTSSHRPTHVRHFAPPPPRSSPPFGGTATRTGTHSDFARFPHTHRHTHTETHTLITHGSQKTNVECCRELPSFSLFIVCLLVIKKSSQVFSCCQKTCLLLPAPVPQGCYRSAINKWPTVGCAKLRTKPPNETPMLPASIFQTASMTSVWG